METLRAARINLDLAANLHPILRHDPVFDLARNQLADAVERLEAAITEANTFSQTERAMP